MKGTTCPGCEQAIVVTDGMAECGGEGEGICCWAHYALNVRDGRPAVWEWTEIDDPDPPSNKLVRAIVEAFDALRDGACPKCGADTHQQTWTNEGRTIHGAMECEDCDWTEADGQPCDKCGVYVPTGEYTGSDKPDGTTEYLCPDCPTDYPEGE
jgi:hypothetical protein